MLIRVEVGCGVDVATMAATGAAELVPERKAAFVPTLENLYVTLCELGILVKVTEEALAVPTAKLTDCMGIKLFAMTGMESLLTSCGGVGMV